jgi:Nickel responsive protein SCO4226-like
VARYLVVRTFDVGEEEMPEVGRRSRAVIEEGYPQIVWEHSHVVVNEDGKVMTFCVYDAPNEELVRNHADDLGKHTIDYIYEIAGDVTPADFPPVAAS